MPHEPVEFFLFCRLCPTYYAGSIATGAGAKETAAKVWDHYSREHPEEVGPKLRAEIACGIQAVIWAATAKLSQ